MNTTAYTPLEQLFLYRGIFKRGVHGDAFKEVSGILIENDSVKADRSYDAARLTPERLQDLFLSILWEAVETDHDATPRPDGGQSPTAKKRRLSPPLRPTTLKESLPYLEKVPAILVKLNQNYTDSALAEIEALSLAEEEARQDVERLEAEVRAEEAHATRSQEQGAELAVEARNGDSPAVGALSNGTDPSPENDRRPISPTVVHTDRRNGSAAPETAPVTTPVTAPSAAPSSATSSASGPSGPSAPAAGLPLLTRQPQAVHGSPVPPISTDVAPRVPESADRFRAPSASHTSQTLIPPQGQLKWEPPYQPPQLATRSSSGFQAPQQNNQSIPKHVQAAPSPPGPQPAMPQSAPRFTQPHPSPTAYTQHGVQHGQGLLAAPASTGPHVPSTQPSPTSPRPLAEAGDQPRSRGQLATPISAQGRSTQPSQSQVPAYASSLPTRPLVTASPTQAQAAGLGPGPGLAQPQIPQQPPRMHSPPALSQYAQTPQQAKVPRPTLSEPSRRASFDPPSQPTRSAIPEHVLQRLGSSTPTGLSPENPMALQPQTPASPPIKHILGGICTRWTSEGTPSTPAGVTGFGEVPSPAYEPLSPVLQPSAPVVVATQSSAANAQQEAPPGTEKRVTKRKGRPPKNKTAGSAPQPVASFPKISSPVKDAPTKEPGPARIKNEEATPVPDAGDSTADESVTRRRRGSHASKRKRRESSRTPAEVPADPLPETPVDTPVDATPDAHLRPTHANEVVWTRAFNKISASAMEQIVHHRYANMFANPIRDRDAPGYDNVILQPQDLKTIRAAIVHGNKAAAQAASALPDGDPGTKGVRLPANEDILPPKGIVNLKQLDRELSHIFANAIMYNPDAGHGPGDKFLRDAYREDADVFGVDHLEGDGQGHPVEGAMSLAATPGYKVDEFAVVNNARAMYLVVERLLSELASPKVERLTRPPPLATSGAAAASTVREEESGDTPASGEPPICGETADHVATGVATDVAAGVAAEVTATETENAPKRRRTTRKTGD